MIYSILTKSGSTIFCFVQVGVLLFTSTSPDVLVVNDWRASRDEWYCYT